MSRKVYLSGSIDNLSYEDAMDWREKASHALAKYGISTFNPLRGMDADKPRSLEPSEAVTRDKRDMRNSDAIIVNLTHHTCYKGTMMEILYAWEHEIPVVVFYGDAKENLGYWVEYHSTKIVKTMEQAMEYIAEYILRIDT